MRALMLALIVVMDAGPPATDAGKTVPVDAGKVSHVDAGKTVVAPVVINLSPLVVTVDAGPKPVVLIPVDAEVPGLVGQLVTFWKDHNYGAAAFIFGMLVMWAAKKLRKEPSKNESTGTVTKAAPEAIVPPANPETK